MLSLGSRDEGMEGIGLGFRSMEENELEEGEAFSGHQDDDACIDPDIALSYIDEKLQDVLGHFQKDFEGGVSAENLGAKFGGYGSFLPSYQRSPTALAQPKSPPRPLNHSVSKSPYNSSIECTRQNPSVPRGTSVKNNTASVAQPSNSSRKENCISSLSTDACVPHLVSNNKAVNVSDLKSLKVRIKVGPDNTLARSNAAIYSGLGLDTPPSSPEDGPDGITGHSPELRYVPGESPLSILQDMTSFSVPGGYLLSPLHESLFQLAENEKLIGRKLGILSNGAPEMCTVPSMTLSTREMRGELDKKVKSDEKNSRSAEEENLSCSGDTTKIWKKEIDINHPASKNVVSSHIDMSFQSCPKSSGPIVGRQVTGDSTKGSNRALDVSEELNKPFGKDSLPIPDSSKDAQCISMGSMKSGAVSYLGNELTYSKGTNNPKTSFTEKDIEVKNPNNHKDVLSDTRSQGKSKNQKNNDISKLNNGEDKVRNDHTGHVEPMKQMPIQKFIPHEKMLQENDQTQEGKRIQKGSRNNCTSVESMQTQGSLRDSSSVVPKEKKKSSHARHHHSENKSKMKSRKDPNRVHSSKSHRDVVGNISAQRAENKADLSESFAVSEKSISRSGFKQEVDLQPELVAHPPVATSSTCTAPTAAAAVALDAPPSVVIQENWVCCDKCQKWRLLPFGADPNNLPKKWKCSMQVWLSGLNKCGISEEETTKAFHALYLVPAPETGANLNGHHDVAALNATSSTHHFDRRFDHDIQSMSAIGKKKSGLTSASNVPKSSVSKKSHQASVKSRSLTDVTEFPLETNSSGKAGLGLTNKSVDFTAENHKHRQKDKHEISVRQSDGGDFIVKGAKHSKSKSKREASQDGLRTSKKIKKENSSYHVEDRLSDLDMSGRTACKMDNGLAAKVTGKIQQNYSDHSSSKDSKSDLRGNLLESTKKSKDPVRLYSNGDFKDHFNVEKSVVPDYAAKKRKVKEWQESQVHQETVMSSHNGLDSRLYAKEAFSEGERRKQKKAKVPGTGEKEFNTSYVNEKTDKKGRSTKMSLSGHREQRSDGMGDEGRFGMERIGYQEAATSRQALDGTDPPKRDMSYAQLPTAATSSSSKVSSSRRSKANMQEAKGSPVESVSSSPLRSAATEKIFIGRNSAAKDDMVTLDASFMGSPKKSSDADLGSDQSGTRRKETVSSAQLNSLERNRAESGVFASMGGASHHSEKETSHLSGSSNKDGLYSKMVAQVDLSSAELEETNIVDDTEKILDHDNKYIFDRTEKENIDGNGDDLNNHRGSGATSQWKSDNSSSGFKDRNKISNLDANRGKLKVSDTINDRKELYSLKKGINLPSGAEFNYNDNCIPHEGSRDENCNFQEKDEAYLGKKISSAKLPPDRRENHSDNGLEESLDAQHKDFNSRHTFAGASCKSNLQENLELAPSYPSENPMSHSLLSHIDRSDMASGTGMPQPVQPPKGNSEAHNSGAQRVATPVKGSRSDTNPTDAANGDAVKLAKQSRKPANQNGVFSNTLRQNTPNSHDSSPLRKDGPVANTVLKEARVLKHTANRLKNEGLDHESIGLYFQSALKFLYGSSLLEPPSAESGKHGEMNPPAQMISMYSDTAKLCEYCAHEYERYKEMAAAALAYKCVEVAYMKVAYYRNPVASKDRHELQTALQAVVPGESPSSSASDIDNLNNQGALDKAALAKAAGSPQITGTHVIAARNRPAFSRLLTYTNDLNCAFDATKRSQNAIAAAGVNLDKDGVDGISSVRKVIDFNFHNVEELLRLVRLSMELIGR